MQKQLNIVFLGLSITSSWGNGHATTFRGLVRELYRRGHTVSFLERDVPWYAQNRDLKDPEYCTVSLYNSLEELYEQHANRVKNADIVVVGSYVPDGIAVGEWVCKVAQGGKCFYDIDTPVTLAKLERNNCAYITKELIGKYDLYLSFTGGRTLNFLEVSYGAPAAKALYCSFDPEYYFPESIAKQWDLGYLGTYSDDRQPPLKALMLDAAQYFEQGRFVVAGPQYPEDIVWPQNVQRIAHLPPQEHRQFYNAQRFTMNITRADMIQAGYSPSVRLFEAAACGTPIISDYWEGLSEIFVPNKEILIARSKDDTLRYMKLLTEDQRLEIGQKAREKVLKAHTAAHRALEMESYMMELLGINVV